MEDLTTLSKIELQNLKLQIDGELDAIKDQLKRAEAEAASNGNYADPNWYWSAVRARQRKARQSQAIQIEFSRRKSKKSVKDHFVDIARIRLSEDLFLEILSEAKYRADN